MRPIRVASADAAGKFVMGDCRAYSRMWIERGPGGLPAAF
jgi:hypothetical protein